jgi:hypothetical protein
VWIAEQSAELRRLGIATAHVLIWKSPDEFLASRRKRGLEHGWQREWINYHRYYFTRIEGWTSIRYRDLVSGSKALSALCPLVGIPYFPGKERYWDRDQHTLFGNDTARIHLFDKASAEFQRAQEALVKGADAPGTAPHRTITYQAPTSNEASGSSEVLARISEVLAKRDVLSPHRSSACSVDAADLRTGILYHAYQVAKMKYGLKRHLTRLGH